MSLLSTELFASLYALDLSTRNNEFILKLQSIPSHHSQQVFFVSTRLMHHAEQSSIPGGMLEALVTFKQ